MPKHKATKPPVCDYCDKVARFHQHSDGFYNGTDYGPVWACTPCGAWVGCHKTGTGTTPLGRLANKELRQAKIRAHAAFDPLWRGKMKRDDCPQHEARQAGYRWLSKQLGIEPADTHIGMFDVETCNRVVAICTPYLRASNAA